MPAIDSLPPADLIGPASAAPGSAGAVGQQTAAGSASPGSQFGDVLSQSISSTSTAAPPAGHAQSPQTASDHAPPAGRHANDPSDANSQTQAGPTTASAQQSTNATTQTAAANSPSSNVDGSATDATANAGPSGQAALLAASLSAAACAARAQPIDPSDVTNSNAAKSASPVSGPGPAPAQLVNNLLQTDIPGGNAFGTVANGASHTTPGNGGEPGAPQALIASLEQAANQAGALSAQTPGRRAVARNATASTDTENGSPAADPGKTLPAAQPGTTPGTSAGVDAINLASLLAASKKAVANAATTSDGPSTGAAGDSTRPNGDAKSTSAASAVDETPGLLQPLLQPEPTLSPALLAGQQSTRQLSGPAPFVGSSLGDEKNRQSTATQNQSSGSLPMLAQMSVPVVSAVSATSSTATFEAGNPTQPSSTSDASQATQQPLSQAPGYLFGTAPPSLQLHATNYSAPQTSSPGSLSSLVLDQAAYAVQYSHVTGQQMQLHLNPPELGALQVDVSLHNGVLTARIEAQTSTAQQILTDNISQLKDSLTQQGVSFDRIDVHLTGSNSGSDGRGMADKSFAQQQDGGLPWDQQFTQPESDDTAPRVPAPATRFSRVTSTSLDIMA